MKAINVFIVSSVLIALTFIPFALSQLPVITIQNNRLFVDGKEFIIKGVNYVPSPIGQKGMNAQGYGGTGYCSAKVTPWFEWKSACYDSDYYDGSGDLYTPSRFPNGFKALWDRDFPWIKSIGANTIRMYNTNPSTLAATKQYTNLFSVPSGKDHTQFMKYCETNGFKVIYPLFGDEKSYLAMDEYVFRRYLKWQIDEVGNSSALLMWQFGNEMTWSWGGRSDNWNNTAYTEKHNRMLNFIRTYTKTKWNRFIPVTTAIPNIQNTYNFLWQNWHVDVFSANIFGLNYDTLAAGNGGNFAGVTKLSCYYNKPFLMTETGPTAAKGQQYNTGALNQIWYQFVKNIGNGWIGAVWFEQTDEPALSKDFGLFGLQVATGPNGTKSDQQDVWTPDTVVKKQQYTDALSGKYNNVAYNIKADIHATLLKRSAYTLTNNPDTCLTKYTSLKACPGSSYPRCSGNGICNRSTGKCTCAPGWSGTTCSTSTCSCNGRGLCNTAVHPIECVCNYGYYGNTCQFAVPTNGSCPGDCTNGNGICKNGVCQCHPGFTGVACGVHDHVPGGSLNIQHYFYKCLESAAFTVTAPSNAALTNQKCLFYCAARNYTYSATTNGNTCYCGDTITSTTAGTACTTACNGDSKQFCGGAAHRSTYYAGKLAGVGYLGCFADNSTQGDVPYLAISGTITVDSCRKTCAAQGYTIAAVQDGSQCRCGNSYGTAGGKVDDSECSSSCSGDSAIKCGGSLRNSIYTSNLPSGYQYY